MQHSYLPMLAITTHDAIALTHASNPHTHSKSVVNSMDKRGVPLIIPRHLSLHFREIEFVDAASLKKRRIPGSSLPRLCEEYDTTRDAIETMNEKQI